jgi:hypothetical protein
MPGKVNDLFHLFHYPIFIQKSGIYVPLLGVVFGGWAFM